MVRMSLRTSLTKRKTTDCSQLLGSECRNDGFLTEAFVMVAGVIVPSATSPIFFLCPITSISILRRSAKQT